MANVSRPNGFRPFGDLLHVGVYVAAGTIYPGDLVKFETGAVNTTQLRARVTPATNGAACMGAAMNYATVGQLIRVADDPSQLFVAQASGAEYDGNDDLGTNAGILATAGDTTYKMSRMEVKSSDQQTTATLELKILGLLERFKNEFGSRAVLIVKINNHQLGSSTGTLAI